METTILILSIICVLSVGLNAYLFIRKVIADDMLKAKDDIIMGMKARVQDIKKKEAARLALSSGRMPILDWQGKEIIPGVMSEK